MVLLTASEVQSLTDSDDNDISLTATTGNLTVGNISAGAAGDVTLTSTAGSILDASGNVTGDVVTLTALDSIGNVANALTTAANSITANVTANGSINVSELDAVTLTSLTTANGSITVVAAGDLTATQVTSTTDLDANDITLTATTGNITAGNISAAGNGDVTLEASAGSILDAAGNVAGQVLTLKAANGIGNSTALTTDAESITANVTATGLMNISEANAVTLTALTTANGSIMVVAGGDLTANQVSSTTDLEANDITLTATTGNITAGNISAAGNGDVTLEATAGSILDAAGNVAGQVLTLKAASGIGNATALTTDAESITANVTADGLINISEANAITLTSLTTANGSISVTANGTITATSVVGSGSGNDVSLTASNGDIAVTSVVAADDANIVTLNGNISVVTLTAGNDILIDANGAITEDGNAATVVSGVTVTANAVTGITLDTSVANIDASVTGNGNISIDESNAVTLVAVDTANGSISVTANGTITATKVQSLTDLSANSISLTATTGDLLAGNISAGSANGDATLVATAGSILDSDAANVTADVLSLTAATGIGNATALSTAANSITANVTANGIMNISEVDAVTLTSLETANGSITVVAGGALTASEVQSLTDSDDNEISLTATTGNLTAGNISAGATGDVTLKSTAGSILDASGNVTADVVTLTALDGIGNVANAVTTAANSITANVTANGSMNISELDAVTLTSLTTANGSITVVAGGDLVANQVVSTTDNNDNDISLTATTGNLTAGNLVAGNTGDITLVSTAGSIVDATGNVSGDVVTLTAATGIGNSTANLTTSANSITANVTSVGNINISEANAVTLTSVTTANGSITVASNGAMTASDVRSLNDNDDNDLTLIATTGNLTAGNISGGTASGDVTLESTVGSILDAAGNVTGQDLTLKAATGIGNATALTTSAATLTANVTGTGQINISEANGVTLTDLITTNGTITVTNPGGGDIKVTKVVSTQARAISITATNGTITVGTITNNTASGGSVSLVANGAANYLIVDDLDQSTLITANSLTLTSRAGIGNAATDGDIDTKVSTITSATVANASFANGNIHISESDGVTITRASAANGSINISAGGTITATRVDVTNGTIDTNDIILTAKSGNIVVGNITAGNVSADVTLIANAGSISSNVSLNNATVPLRGDVLTLSTREGIGNISASLSTSVNSMNASVSSIGNIFISESNAVTLTSLSAFNGSISVTANGTITATQVHTQTDTDSNDITLTASNGNIVVGNITATGNGDVTLTATTGAITDDANTTTLIAGDVLTMTANTAIGNATDAIATSVNGLTASTNNGAIFIIEANGLTALNLNAGTANANLTLTLGGITDSDNAEDITANVATITLSGDTAAFGNGANAVSANVNSLSISTVNGDIFVTEANGLTALNLDAGTANANLTLTLGGITDADVNRDIRANSTTIFLSGANAALGNSANAVQVDVNNLTATTTNGDVFITEANGLSALNLDAGTANANLTLTLGGITDEDGDRDVRANIATVLLSQAGASLGNAANSVQTDVSGLTVTTTNGDIFITEANGLAGVNLDAGTANANLTLTLGGITDSDGITDIRATNATVRLIGSAAALGNATNSVQTDVSNLTATTTNGDIFITEANGLTALNLDAGTANANLSLTLGGITDADNDTDVKANVATIQLSDSAAALGNATNNFQTDVSELTATTTNGDIFIAEANGLTGLNLDAGTANANLTLTLGGITDADGDTDIRATNATVRPIGSAAALGNATNSVQTDVSSLTATTTNGDIFITEANGLTALNLDAGTANANLTLTLGGITDADNDTDVKANVATILLSEAAAALGNASNNLQTDVSGISATTTNGDIFITEANGLTGLNLDAGTANANLTLTLGGITDGDLARDLSANIATLVATSIGNQANPISTTVDELDFAANGELWIEEQAAGGNISVHGVNSGEGQVVSITALGEDAILTVTSGNIATVNGALRLIADDMNIAGNISTGLADVTLSTANADQVIDLGTDSVGSKLGLTNAELNRIATTGVLRVGTASNTGGIQISNGITATSYTRLTLTTGGSITDETAGEQPDLVVVGNLALQAGTGIGNDATNGDINIEVTNLSAKLTGDGDIFVTNNGDLTVMNVDSLTTSNGIEHSGNGNVTLVSTGALTVTNAIEVANGNIALTANGDISATANIDNQSASTTDTVFLTSSNGSITVNTPASINTDQLAIEAANTVNISGNVDIIAANLTEGSFEYTDADGVSVGTVEGVVGLTTANGDITVATSNGDLVIDDDIDAGVLSVTLTAEAGKAITANANVSAFIVSLIADNLDLQSDANISGAAVDIKPNDAANISIDLGGFDNATTLGIADEEIQKITAGLLEIGSNETKAISITANIDLVNFGQVQLTANGDFTFEANGSLNGATTGLSLTTSNGDIVNNDITANINIVADSLLIEASNGLVGSSTNAVTTDVNQLTANTSVSNGDIFISEANGLDFLDLNAGSGNVELEVVTGNIVAGPTSPGIVATTAIISLLEEFATVADELNPLNTQVDELTITTANGDIFVTEANGLANLSLDAGTGNVTLTVTEGSIFDTDNANDVVGNLANITVSNGSFGAAGSGNAIVTSVNELSVGTTNWIDLGQRS